MLIKKIFIPRFLTARWKKSHELYDGKRQEEFSIIAFTLCLKIHVIQQRQNIGESVFFVIFLLSKFDDQGLVHRITAYFQVLYADYVTTTGCKIRV